MIKTSLNYKWSFEKGFNSKSVNEDIESEVVDLPHSVKLVPKNYFDETITQGMFTYQKTFPYELKKDRRLFLMCEGIMSKATIYFNGEELMTHVGGYTAFKVELTDYVKDENRLTIQVDSRETGDHPPFGHVVDYLTYGGIYREVDLLETSLDTMDYLLVDGDEHELNIRAKLNSKHKPCQCQFDVYDGENLISQYIETSSDDVITLKKDHQLELWTIDHPKLYTLKAYINNELVEETRFGVRRIKVDASGFYLNGKKVFLRGLNRHQSYPYVGYAMPASAQRKDVDILKEELQVTIVRSSHYPPSKHFLDRCDEVGLLVFTELPGWQHIGDDTWKNHALNDLESLVIHDYNHPSIVMIGTRINESKDDDEFYQKTRDLVKSIDQSRPTGGVRFFANSHLFEDVYTVNDFIHSGQNQGLTKKRKMTKQHHPYLVTEFNGHMFPTKAFDDETKRIHHSLRHFKVLNDAYHMDGLMGAIGWCMNDYHTHRAFGSNDHMCYHGVLDINRNPKYAASVYASQGDKPYLNVLSMMHIGDRPSGEISSVVVSTNCDYVELYKGDTWIGTYYPSKRFEHLPHPPIIIDDFIGNQIADHEIFSKKDAKIIKNIMLYMLKHSLQMRLRDKFLFGYILLKYKMTYNDAVQLYTKYVGGWGNNQTQFIFKGYQNGQCVKEIQKGVNDDYKLNVWSDEETLMHGHTFDVTRCTVELVNAFEERAFYSTEVVTIQTEGAIELIGPELRVLQGGIESFWVKSLKTGDAKIKITSDNYGVYEISLKVK